MVLVSFKCLFTIQGTARRNIWTCLSGSSTSFLLNMACLRMVTWITRESLQWVPFSGLIYSTILITLLLIIIIALNILHLLPTRKLYSCCFLHSNMIYIYIYIILMLMCLLKSQNPSLVLVESLKRS